MNDNYERTETRTQKLEHDVAELLKSIDHLESELEIAQQYRDTLEVVNRMLREDLLKALKTIGKIRQLAEYWKSISDHAVNTFALVTSNHADEILQILGGEQSADD